MFRKGVVSAYCHKVKVGSRGICFDERISRKFHDRNTALSRKELTEVNNRRNPKYIWYPSYGVSGDGLFRGASVSLSNGTGSPEKYFIIARTTHAAVVLRDENSSQLFTVRAIDLPVLTSLPSLSDKQRAADEMMALLDSAAVKSITIERPSTKAAPLVFDAKSELDVRMQQDIDHPYMVIQYKDESRDSVAFACTSARSSPHRTPLKMLVADGRCGKAQQLWDTDMKRRTAVDLSRMASFPAKMLYTHFVQGQTWSVARQPGPVLYAVTQMLMAHVLMDGGEDDESEDDCYVDDELPYIADDEEFPASLVIGHYEVDDETGLPLPGALDV